MPTLIDTAPLLKIGDMLSGGGVTAAVNTGDGGATGYKQSTTGWAGVALATSTAISHVEVTSAANGFDASGSQTSITLRLYGRQGTAPGHGTNGVLLGTLGPFTDVNATTTRTIQSTDTTTQWDYIWVTGTTGVWTVYESIKPYAADSGPPATQYQQTFGPASEYSTENILVTTLPITTGPYPNLIPKQLMRLNIGPVQDGDVISCFGEVEFTNDNNYATSVVSQISLAKNSTLGQVITDIQLHQFSRAATADAYKVCKSNGPNVDKSIIHHSPHFRAGSIMVSPEMADALGAGDIWVIFWAWAASTAAGSGHVISVGDNETGQLVALKHRYA